MLLSTTSLVVFLLVLLVQLQTQVLASTRPWPSSSSSTAPSMVAKQGCKDRCGNLTIPYPFGIGKGCYFDKPFEITCNDSTPWYVTNSNVYYSQVYDITMDTFRIESFFFPFPYNKSTGKSIYRDERLDGVFKEQYASLSATENKFMAIGCDIYAYIKDTESGEIVSGCASFCNTNHTSSSASTSCTGNNGCCKSVISRIPPRDTSIVIHACEYHHRVLLACAAFVLFLRKDYFFALLVQIQTQILASRRPWASSSLSVPSMVAKQGCKDKCGNLAIPYPFGIGRGCYFDKPFEIVCNGTTAWFVTNSNAYYSQVYDISMDSFRIDSFFFPVLYNKSSGKSIYGDEPIEGVYKEKYFSLSATGNKFIAIGCDIYAYVKDRESGEIVTGCASFCNTNHSSSSASTSCTGNNGCCKSVIPRLPPRDTSLVIHACAYHHRVLLMCSELGKEW